MTSADAAAVAITSQRWRLLRLRLGFGAIPGRMTAIRPLPASSRPDRDWPSRRPRSQLLASLNMRDYRQ
jgi:hypothetical protein